jgi:DNA-directed RNA polymerase II subunit RPB1
MNDAGDATNEDDYQDENRPNKPKGHGGCGAEQPLFRKEGLKLIGVFKPSKEKQQEVSFLFIVNLTSPGGCRA